MTTTLLERTRASHEDIELFERAIVEVLVEDAKTVWFIVNYYIWLMRPCAAHHWVFLCLRKALSSLLLVDPACCSACFIIVLIGILYFSLHGGPMGSFVCLYQSLLFALFLPVPSPKGFSHWALWPFPVFFLFLLFKFFLIFFSGLAVPSPG